MEDEKEVSDNINNIDDTLISELFKKGKINKAWKLRYFIASRSSQIIRYFENETDLNQSKNEKGRIEFTSIHRVEVNISKSGQKLPDLPKYVTSKYQTKPEKPHMFHLVTAGRKYILAAHDAPQLMQWLNFLHLCLYSAKVIKSGFLKKKQGNIQKSYKSHFFILNATQHIKLYDAITLNNCLEVIDCKEITQIDQDKEEADTVSVGYTFDVHTDSMKWLLAAKSQKERSEWLQYIEIMRNNDWQQQLKKRKPLKVNKRPKDDDSGFFERPTIPLDDDKKEEIQKEPVCINKDESVEPLKIHKRPMDDSGFLERPNMSKSDEPNEPYTINEAEIHKWFGKQQLMKHCDKKKREDDEKAPDFTQCHVLNRIAVVMSSTKQNIQKTFDTFFQDEKEDDAIYSLKYLLNDYHHIMEEHDAELEDLRSFLIKQHRLQCCESQARCAYLARNYRNRSLVNEDTQLYATNDSKMMLVRKHLDKIHGYIFHSFDLNYRLTKQEQLRIFGEIASQKEDKKYDDDDDDEDEDADLENQEAAQQIDRMQNIINKKRARMKALVGESAITNNKFVTNVVSEKQSDKSSKQLTASEYSFGFPFKYYDRFKHQKWFVHKKYSDMKQEILNNPFHTLPLSSYQQEVEGANAFLKSDKIKSLQCKHIERTSEPQSLDTGIKDKSPITVPHLLALLFYCNYTQLCTVFSSTFRRIKANESDEEVKQRNAHFFHWCKLLREAIHLFGTPLSAKMFGKHAYHGVSRMMVFNNMNQGVYGPFSTTSQFNVALQFATDAGLVLTLSRSSRIKNQKYFDCAPISDFSGEAEKLFLDGLLEIDDILHVGSTITFAWYCRAFKVLTSMLDATALNSKIARKKHAAFYLSMMKSCEKYHEYVQALWKHTVNSIKKVSIDLQLMNVTQVDTDVEELGGLGFLLKFKKRMRGNVTECDKYGFKLLNSFLMQGNGWIHVERLCQLLPNLEVIDIERYKRSDYGNKMVESLPLNEALMDHFVEYEPLFPINIVICKPNEEQMSFSSFVAKCRESQKGKKHKQFVVLSGTINSDNNLKCLYICYGDSPLHQACTNGEDELVLQLLQSDDAKVNESINQAAHNTNATPLVIACDQAHTKCVEHMLSHPDVNINAMDKYNNNALMMSIMHGDNDIAHMLLAHSDKMKEKGIKHGVLDINHVDDDGNSALHDAARNDIRDMAEALIQRNINLDFQNSDRQSALHIACEKQYTEMVEILLKNGANPNLQSAFGKTTLMEAINARYTQGIDLLLKYKADVNIINSHDEKNQSATAMYYAIKMKTKNTASLLLGAGFDPTIIGRDGRTLLYIAAKEEQVDILKMLYETVSKTMTKEQLCAFVNQPDDDGDNALIVAALDDARKDCVEYLLQNTPCDVNIVNKKGKSALSAALVNDYPEIAQMLMEAGAKTDIFDDEGKSLLYFAADNGNIDMMKAIYTDYKSNYNKTEAPSFINHVDNEGKTVLHAACTTNLGKNVECVQYLIWNGAKVDVFDKNGGSIFHAIATGWSGFKVMKEVYDSLDWEWDEDKIKQLINHSDNNHETPLFASANDIKCARYLLTKGAVVDPLCDLNKVNKYKDTALSNAASEGCLEMVNVLMDAGAKIDTLNWQNETPLHQAAESAKCEVMKAIYNRYLQNTNVAAAKEFVNRKTKDLGTALFIAARQTRGIESVKFLLSVGAEVNIFEKEGMSPLTKAAAFGEPDSLKALYNHYLKTTDLAAATKLVNHKDKNKKTALHHAAELGYIECAEFLLNNGAQITPSDIDKEHNSILHLAAQGGDIKCMKVIYEHIAQRINENEAKEFVNHRNEKGETALITAAEYKKKDLVLYLHGIGAEINVFETVKGQSALHVDANQEEIELTKTIYELYLNGTNLEEATKFVNVQNFNKATALHIACSNKCKDKVKYFMDHTNCDVNLKNNDSETPLMIAAKKGCTEIVTLLLEKGVNLVDKDGNCEALRLAKQKKKECADAIEEYLKGTLSLNKATEIIEKYPENYPEDDDDDDCLIM